jgi:chromosome segregation ATPase
VDAWLDVRVTKHDASADNRLFRRRIPLELTAAEITLLEDAQPEYGSKRATLVAGLEALAALDQARADLAVAEAARDAALGDAAALGERARKAEQAGASQVAKTKSSAQSAKASSSKLEQQLQRAQQQVDQLAEALADEQDARLAWEQAHDQLQAEMPSMLRCHRCKQ